MTVLPLDREEISWHNITVMAMETSESHTHTYIIHMHKDTCKNTHTKLYIHKSTHFYKDRSYT